MALAALPALEALPDWDFELIPPSEPIATPFELAPASFDSDEKAARDQAEIAAFAAAQPAAKARAAARRSATYALVTCVFIGFAVLSWLRWLRASLPHLRVVATNARARLAVEWTRSKERVAAR